MNGIILYQSKYGATKKYADWLSEATGFPAQDIRRTKASDLRGYDLFLVGGGIYASGIAGLSFLKKNPGVWKGKRVLVFCVGASPYDENAFAQIVRRNLTGDLTGLPCFYCRGAYDMARMHVVDRTLCGLLRKSVQKKAPEEYEPWEQALVEAGDSPCDWTDKAYLQPLLAQLSQPG